jgi:hypothetical protein
MLVCACVLALTGCVSTTTAPPEPTPLVTWEAPEPAGEWFAPSVAEKT